MAIQKQVQEATAYLKFLSPCRISVQRVTEQSSEASDRDVNRCL